MLTGCAEMPAPPSATESKIATIAVIIAPWSKVQIGHRSLYRGKDRYHEYEAKDWGVDDMKMAALRQSLEPRYQLTPIPAPAVDEKEMLYATYGHRVDSIVRPAMAQSGVKADAVLFLDSYLEFAFFGSKWQYAGCGVFDKFAVSLFLTEAEHVTEAYCITTVHLIDPSTLQDLGVGHLRTEGGDDHAMVVLPDFDWHGVQLSPDQIERARAAMAGALNRYMPGALKHVGLIP